LRLKNPVLVMEIGQKGGRPKFPIKTSLYDKRFEDYLDQLTKGKKPGKVKFVLVLDSIGHFRGDFTIRDLQESCPHVGIDLIRRILREQKNMGKLECLGRGPNAKWRNR